MSNFVERIIVRKDVADWLDTHWTEIQPLVLKLMPFLKPSLVAWAQAHSGELTGVLCDEIVKAYEAHTLGEEQ